MQKTEVLKTMVHPFPISTTVMLGYGFKEIRYAIIDETFDYVDGIFYFDISEGDRITQFANKLQEANQSGLITDFDYITDDMNFILLRQYKRELKENEAEVLNK